ncbi:tRNA (guanine) methyltransferase ASCRUDRAFT_37084 [Ascoidea rubescens DSM 1968]|uniref:tRNA (guanine(37)-N1)-methyltransferase n=1 Tax=Ascoidea rubescens DSM 1968 TaxID=1344418 RepID=A0A1D2VDD9_9ASCO|nr:hypothetical protein ASCRUDRAFT_37084 [Ascoidea rubescens DSM 1968]ODV59655.1 hypothetical protein ASCRUDRAFT_37084 [Ascoidea rubescens DSM 1968]
MTTSAPHELSLSETYLPPVNKNMRHLDRSFFYKEVPLVALYFEDPKLINDFIKNHKDVLLGVRSVPNLVKVPNIKELLTKNDIKTTNLHELKSQVSTEIFHYLTANQTLLFPYTLKLDYSFWKTDEILNAILPIQNEENPPSSFTTTGHIAHMNLKEEYLPYKNLIGQVILDKTKAIKTVVTKTNSIETKFRTFPMEIIAGENNFDVEQKESNCIFRFNFEKVYWNSRLHTEHDRLINLFQPNQLICDVMAGVGPFAIPAAKKKCVVLANDLNPESFKYLKINNKLNKTEKFVQCYNLDGNDFIKNCTQNLIVFLSKHFDNTIIVKKEIRNKKQKKNDGEISHLETIKLKIPNFYSHFIMNLPDSALEFLPSFIGCYSDINYQKLIQSDASFKLPYIHVYCFEKFSPSEKPEPSIEELQQRIYLKIINLLNCKKIDAKFHLVRKVAPTKPMFCVSFLLPECVAFKKHFNS